MKSLLTVLLFLTCIASQAQDTLYYDSNGDKAASLQQADSYSVTIYNRKDTSNKSVSRYRKNGQLISTGAFNKGKADGRHIENYDNGKLHIDIEYDNGDYVTLKSYWRNGTLKRSEKHDKGKMVSGICYNGQGKEIPFYEFEVMPEFPGGEDGLMQYISGKLVYPKKALENNIEGEVKINFVINEEGVVKQAKVGKSVSKELDEEALRVVKSMPRWKPGKQDGNLVSVSYTLPVTFALDDE